MDSISTSGRKSRDDGPRKVRCPKCRRVLLEPTDLPLYRCGYCNTILQAKYYKTPPVDAGGSVVSSETTTSLENVANNGSEENLLMERIESISLSKQSLSDVHTVETSSVKDEASGQGRIHSDSNSEKSCNNGEILKNKEGIVDKVLSEQPEKKFSPVDDHSSLPASDADIPAVSGRDYLHLTGMDSPQANLEGGGCEMDGAIQKSESVFLNGSLSTDVNMVEINSMKGEAYNLDRKPANFNSVPCNHQRSKLESEDGIQFMVSGELVKNRLMIESTESESKCVANISGSCSPANSGRDSPQITLLEGDPGADGSSGIEFMPLDEKKSSEGEMVDTLSLKDEISELNSRPSCLIAEKWHSETNTISCQENEVENTIILEKVEMHPTQEKNELENKSPPLVTDTIEIQETEVQTPILCEKVEIRSIQKNVSLPSETTIQSQENEVQTKILCGKAEVTPIQEKNELESKSLPFERNAIGSLECEVWATILHEKVELIPIQEKNKAESKSLPSGENTTGSQENEVTPTILHEKVEIRPIQKSEAESNFLPSETNTTRSEIEAQTDILHEVETSPIQEKNELESKSLLSETNTIGSLEIKVERSLILEMTESESRSLPSITGVRSPTASEIILYKAIDSKNNIAGNELLADCESMHLKHQHIADTDTEEMISANEEPFDITRNSQTHFQQYVYTENMKHEKQETRKEFTSLSEQAEKTSDLEVDNLKYTQHQSLSHCISPAELREISFHLNNSDKCCAIDGLKGNVEVAQIVEKVPLGDVQERGSCSNSLELHCRERMDNCEDPKIVPNSIVGTISLKGDVQESKSNPHSPELQNQERKNWKISEAKTMSTHPNMQVVNNTSDDLYDFEIARSSNIEMEQVKSGDSARVDKVNTVDIVHCQADDNRFLSIRTRENYEENVSSSVGQHDNPPTQLLQLPKLRGRSKKSAGSFSSMSKDEVEYPRARDVNDTHQQIHERKFLQGRQGLDASRNEPSSRNVVRGSFQRKSSDFPEDFRSVKNWIESEREELLRSLSRCSDSTEFDRERIEILNKIDELRQLLSSGTLSRKGSNLSYLEGRSHQSQSSISESVLSEENGHIDRTRSPRSYPYGLPSSPQQLPSPTPCIHRNCRGCCNICSRNSNNGVLQCKLHSRITERNNHPTKHLHRGEREHDFTHYYRPILGAAHFLSCYECFQVLEIPEHFDFMASRYKQLRCGACQEILEFSVLGNTQIVPYPHETRESVDSSVVASNYRHGRRASNTMEEHSRSGHSTNHDHGSPTLRNPKKTVRRKDGEHPPLHSLMGYVSARDIIFQED